MATAGHEETGLIGSCKNRGNCSDIRQMGAPMERVVADHHISRLQGRYVPRRHLRQQVPNRFSHRAQMHRDVGGIGHQSSCSIEQGTGEIESLADIHRATGLTQSIAHAFSDHHEAVVEKAQIHRIHPLRFRRDPTRLSVGGWSGLPHLIVKQQITTRQAARLPADIKHEATGGLLNQSRALKHLVLTELIPPPEGN